MLLCEDTCPAERKLGLKTKKGFSDKKNNGLTSPKIVICHFQGLTLFDINEHITFQQVLNL